MLLSWATHLAPVPTSPLLHAVCAVSLLRPPTHHAHHTHSAAPLWPPMLPPPATGAEQPVCLAAHPAPVCPKPAAPSAPVSARHAPQDNPFPGTWWTPRHIVVTPSTPTTTPRPGEEEEEEEEEEAFVVCHRVGLYWMTVVAAVAGGTVRTAAVTGTAPVVTGVVTARTAACTARTAGHAATLRTATCSTIGTTASPRHE